MRADLPIRAALGVAVFLLAACGSSDDRFAPGLDFDGMKPERMVELTGALPAGTGQVVVCLDSDFNLRCDEGEPAVLAAGGDFRLSVPESTSVSSSILVAEYLAGGMAGAATRTVEHVLATPADGERRIGVLGTLVALRMQQERGLSAADAWRKVEQEDLRLQGHVPLDQMYRPAPAWAEVERAALAALGQATGQVRRLDGASSAPAATTALAGTLSRYMDPEERGLLPTVSERTLASDLVGSVVDNHCPLPVAARITIDTEGGAPIASRNKSVAATVRIDGDVTAGGGSFVIAAATVGGRGNSTWAMPKKPYKVKFNDKIAVLGMKSAKKWALLANYADKTMLRNSVAFCLAHKLGMEYTPQSRYAELTLNGEYLGLYQITNKTDEAEKAVSTDDPVSVDDGFVLEIDERRDADFWFDSSAGIPYAIDSDSTPAQAADVEAWVNDLEAILDGPADSGYLAAVSGKFDIESFVDLYLVNELMRNNDAFWSSTFFYRKETGPLMSGPVWDFDIAAGNIDYNGHDATDGWMARNVSAYFGKLARDPAFLAHVTARWRYLSSQMPQVRQFIAGSAAAIDDAQQRNFERWPILDIYVWPNAVVTGSYQGEIDYLDGWLAARASWIDGQLLPAN